MESTDLIKLAKQVKGFKGEVEYFPENPDVIEIHISERVTDERILMYEEKWSDKKRPDVVDDFFGIKGVKTVTLEQYSINIEKGRMFDWDDILPKVLKIIVHYFK